MKDSEELFPLVTELEFTQISGNDSSDIFLLNSLKDFYHVPSQICTSMLVDLIVSGDPYKNIS